MRILGFGLIPQILVAVLLGALLGYFCPGLAASVGLLGELFVGMLKAVGVSPMSILFIFMFQGCFIGILSSALGLVGGYVTLLNRQSIIDMIGFWNTDMHFLHKVPMEIMEQDVYLIASVSVIICTLAAFFPALAAVCVNPVKAIQSND